MNNTIKNDDFACLHHSYHEDTDLNIVADILGEEHGWAGAPLVWLYWPRMIAAAKAAKTFGWFSMTPKQLAQSVGDMTDPLAWNVRRRMWELLQGRDLIRVRQGLIVSASEKVDVLLVEWQKWQSMSTIERKKLQRERERVDAGSSPSWWIEHWDEFAAFVTPTDPLVTQITTNVTRDAVLVTQSGADVTTRDKTRQDVTNTSTSDRPKLDLSMPAREVFEHWCSVMQKRTNTIFSKDRQAKVKARLREGYTVDQLKEAITGYTHIPFNMGDNADNRRWDDLELICRSGSNVDKGIEAGIAATNRSASGVTPDAQALIASLPRLDGAA